MEMNMEQGADMHDVLQHFKEVCTGWDSLKAIPSQTS